MTDQEEIYRIAEMAVRLQAAAAMANHVMSPSYAVEVVGETLQLAEAHVVRVLKGQR
jgi:hypothetical protein